MMRLKSMTLKRLVGSSLLHRYHHHPLMAGYQHPIPPHALWIPSMQAHVISSAPCLAQRNGHLYAKTWGFFLPKGLHAFSHAAHAPKICNEDDEVDDTIDDHDCKDREVIGAATALYDYMQKELSLSPSDAAAVVEGAPRFVLHLAAVTKQENRGEADVVTENEFSLKVHAYLSDVGTNLLEPVLESIGAKGECLQYLLVQLSAENVQSIFSLIRVFEKLGVPRSSLGIMVSEDPQVLSCTEDEIEAGFHVLKGLITSEGEMLGLIQRYPLILKSDAMRSISLIYDELEEFASRDDIIKCAVLNNPQHVH
ncbi:hypothetical protein GOP47_0001301, partial [Adiantum capillus-veneris]